MSRRGAALLGWSMWVLGVSLMVAGVLIDDRNPPISTTQPDETVLESLIWTSSFVGFGLVGALLVSSRPTNRIGWILSGITFTMGFGSFVGAYGRYALVTAPGTLPLGPAAAWLATWGVMIPVTLVVFLVLLYPTGSVTTRLGRFVGRSFVFLAVLDLVAFALRPGPVTGDTPPDNPLGIPGAKPFFDPIIGSLGTVLGLLALTTVVDLLLRFRLSRGVERLQFRWFLAAVGAFPILFMVGIFLEEAGMTSFDPTVVIFPIWGLGTAAAIAIAITRHGLYEIDRIISRTLSYLVVVGLLALLFIGAVTGLTTLLPAESSNLAVAGSTLAVAALFNPVRKRVQGWVDRRFNRSRYDAQLVMDRFADTLRTDVGPEGVAEGWVSVVSATMNPSVVGVWIRQETRNDFGTVGG